MQAMMGLSLAVDACPERMDAVAVADRDGGGVLIGAGGSGEDGIVLDRGYLYKEGEEQEEAKTKGSRRVLTVFK